MTWPCNRHAEAMRFLLRHDNPTVGLERALAAGVPEIIWSSDFRRIRRVYPPLPGCARYRTLAICDSRKRSLLDLYWATELRDRGMSSRRLDILSAERGNPRSRPSQNNPEVPKITCVSFRFKMTRMSHKLTTPFCRRSRILCRLMTPSTPKPA